MGIKVNKYTITPFAHRSTLEPLCRWAFFYYLCDSK